MRTFLVLTLFLIAGCKNGGVTTTPPVYTVPPPTDPRVVLSNQYMAFQEGDAAAFVAHYAPDAFAFGPLASDAYASIDETRTGYERAFEAFNPDTVVSTNLQLHEAGPDCAWAYDQVDATVTGATPKQFFVTTLLENNGGSWRIVVQNWSMPVRPTYILYRANRNEWPAIAELAEDIGPGAEGPRDQIRQWLEAKQFEPVSGRTDSIVIAAWPNDDRVGDEQVVHALTQLQNDSQFLLSPIGGAHARTVCGGQMAYVAFGQRVEMQSVNGPSVIIPTRGLAFFINDGARMRPLMMQASLGFPSYPE